MPVFPNNEFFQCPSWTWSSFVLSTIITLVVILIGMVFGNTGYAIAGGVGSFLMIVWGFYVLSMFFAPNVGCKSVGYPTRSYINPFAPSLPS